MQSNIKQVVAIVGPTASGKTSLSVSVALHFNGEIISADSMQIYKGMDIATAKPSDKEKRGITHHLMDYVLPDENYSVARFISDACKACEDIMSRGKLPIIAGGTGLYVDSFLNGISFSDGDTDFSLRDKLMSRCETEGIDSLLDELKGIDPASAERLSTEKNKKRIVRALEIYYTTGRTQTEQNLLSKLKPSEYAPVYIGLNFRDRERLYERINRRVDLMVEAGLIKEAKEYFGSNLSSTSVQAIGYKELKPYFDGEKTLGECLELLKQATRRYAKRQLTWFRRNNEINWFFVDDYNNFEELSEDVFLFLKSKGFEINENQMV